MPSEYKIIKRIVNNLVQHNDLGNRPIRFTIIAGLYTEWRASDLKLCKEDNCRYYSELNPFISHQGKGGRDINEAIRQSYLYNGTEAYASPNGTITLARSTFPIYKNKEEFLACTIAHELTHFLSNHSFNKSILEGIQAKGLQKKDRELIGKLISREQEKEADKGSIKMTFNAGYPLDTCLKKEEFRSRIEGKSLWSTTECKRLGPYRG